MSALTRSSLLVVRAQRYTFRLLNLPARGRHKELHELFGDVRLESLGVTVLEADDIGGDAPVATLVEFGHLGLVRSRQQTPARAQLIQAARVVDVTAFRVDDLLRGAARTTTEFRGPLRRVGNALVIDFTAT